MSISKKKTGSIDLCGNTEQSNPQGLNPELKAVAAA
jgi:hypothetical protein